MESRGRGRFFIVVAVLLLAYIGGTEWLEWRQALAIEKLQEDMQALDGRVDDVRTALRDQEDALALAAEQAVASVTGAADSGGLPQVEQRVSDLEAYAGDLQAYTAGLQESVSELQSSVGESYLSQGDLWGNVDDFNEHTRCLERYFTTSVGSYSC